LDIIDRLTPDASASISSEKWFFFRKWRISSASTES